LVATSTHDSKRSEDVRARILAISEIPQLWGRSLQKWRTANRRFKKQIDEAEAPDTGEEYLLYQTLLGTWPIDANGAPISSVGQGFVTRIQRYMAKALKEAKLNTSWIQPNENWDDAMQEFVAGILEAGPRNKFLPTFLPVAGEIARLGTINSLAQTAIKLTAPGVPDIYQGSEIWDDSLVDPDNRRPIDYARRRELLAQIEKVSANELIQCWPDGRIKMRLTQRLLHLRRDNAELFGEGNYEPVNFAGAFADCAIGFVRRREDRAIIVIVPRLSSRVGFPPIGDRWQDTHVVLPSYVTGLQDVFCDRELHAQNSQLKLAVAMAQLPFAVFRNS
jgi:(1->4)-alpha-D-glucan 1-alpha-D-glucosylmutase